MLDETRAELGELPAHDDGLCYALSDRIKDESS